MHAHLLAKALYVAVDRLGPLLVLLSFELSAKNLLGSSFLSLLVLNLPNFALYNNIPAYGLSSTNTFKIFTPLIAALVFQRVVLGRNMSVAYHTTPGSVMCISRSIPWRFAV